MNGKKNWDIWVDCTVYAYNSGQHSTVKSSPNELMMGRRLGSPSELLRRASVAEAARKPKGLSADFTYVMSSVTGRLAAEKRGVEYFVGEQELMTFGRRQGLLELSPLPSFPASREPEK
ncbi:uncharacterized protein PITG_03025 [Phytophthora infestans T30-4]|uniref:Integrase catalytic domain-containing protein n=1 Tax=Phytophthora infestans (strain T30-4) TaxID=403677 RepID=D0MZ66_PHYIT|nr:uncharacterized protein PITG_03025 [Phytophthora infestans T30-4]EEY65529.1 hypothetical protein PITG_03025 [Phytophthora infestans T30-4]|eukprot:XP_002906128.1 hypothetical protein PITG_03025 [Phytophthora infestans T30-4]